MKRTLVSNPFYRPLTTLTCMIPIGTRIKWLQPHMLNDGFFEREGIVDAYVTTTIQEVDTLEVQFSYRVSNEFVTNGAEPYTASMYFYLGADTEIEVIDG